MAEPAALPPPVRDHLQRLTGRHGIYQHARGPVPDRRYGTCTDDVARALVVDVQHAWQLGWPAVEATAAGSLDYLHAAFDPTSRMFRNFRADDGTWLDIPPSQDCQGRALLALATVAATVPVPALPRPGVGEPAGSPPAGDVARAAQLFGRALPAATELSAVRAIASTLLACGLMAGPAAPGVDGAGSLARGHGAGLMPAQVLERLAVRLGEALGLSPGRGGLRNGPGGLRDGRGAWPWPEPAVTYEAFLLPRAMLIAGDQLGRDDLLRLGRGVLDWLLDHLVDRAGRFHPVGNQGWWHRDGAPARFDQQPIEAGSLAAAADAAHQVTGDARYAAAAEAAYGWFTGCNDLGLPVALSGRGACQDGLEAGGINVNQGAESTLAWLATVEHVRAIRTRGQAGQRSGSKWPWGSGRGQDSTYSSTAL